MTARRYVLAWSTGASLGYVVGWLAGSAVRDQRDFRVLRRGRRATAAFLAGAGADPTPEQRARARATAQRMPLWREAFPFTPCPVSSPTHHLPCIRVGAHDEHWWRDPRTEEKR